MAASSQPPQGMAATFGEGHRGYVATAPPRPDRRLLTPEEYVAFQSEVPPLRYLMLPTPSSSKVPLPWPLPLLSEGRCWPASQNLPLIRSASTYFLSSPMLGMAVMPSMRTHSAGAGLCCYPWAGLRRRCCRDQRPHQQADEWRDAVKPDA